jgi:hypothetical protein
VRHGEPLTPGPRGIRGKSSDLKESPC